MIKPLQVVGVDARLAPRDLVSDHQLLVLRPAVEPALEILVLDLDPVGPTVELGEGVPDQRLPRALRRAPQHHRRVHLRPQHLQGVGGPALEPLPGGIVGLEDEPHEPQPGSDIALLRLDPQPTPHVVLVVEDLRTARGVGDPVEREAVAPGDPLGGQGPLLHLDAVRPCGDLVILPIGVGVLLESRRRDPLPGLLDDDEPGIADVEHLLVHAPQRLGCREGPRHRHQTREVPASHQEVVQPLLRVVLARREGDDERPCPPVCQGPCESDLGGGHVGIPGRVRIEYNDDGSVAPVNLTKLGE